MPTKHVRSAADLARFQVQAEDLMRRVRIMRGRSMDLTLPERGARPTLRVIQPRMKCSRCGGEVRAANGIVPGERGLARQASLGAATGLV
jgi:hypothetical protein